MDTTLLHAHYLEKGFGEAAASDAVAFVDELSRSLSESGRTLGSVTLEDLAAYVAHLVETGGNSEARLLALARYFRLTGAQDLYIYFTRLFGGDGVLDSIRERAEALEGRSVAERIFAEVTPPPLGTKPEDMPVVAVHLMEALEAELPPDRVRAVLCGNHHRIPRESFAKERERCLASGSIDAYLRDRHERMVQELQKHCDEGSVWFEQTITQRVVELVRSDQEYLSAVRDGNVLHATKIPYDPDRWLGSTDAAERRFLACHCPFVRESLRPGGESLRDGFAGVAPDWCHCSAGFEKLLFDVALGADLEVEVEESVLKGDDRCRFAIHLPEVPR